MDIRIRPMEEKDRSEVIGMMRRFYQSDAVLTNGSDEIFHRDVDCCVGCSPYLEGYVFDRGGMILGYAMLAKSFSTEFGKHCVWIEDLYVKGEHRNMGIGSSFLKFAEEKYPDSVFRLELEEQNKHAFSVYRKNGFEILPYMEMKK